MSDFNKCFVLGRLVRNVETKTTADGLFIAHFSIATNQAKKNQDGSWDKIAHFIDFSLYGNRANALAPYLIQGQQVAIEGHIIQRRWEKDGKKFSRLEIAVDDIKLIGSPSSKNTDTETNSSEIETAPLEEHMYSSEVPSGEEFAEPEFTEDIVLEEDASSEDIFIGDEM
ncbi:MAG: single-stranded DNA-binding protein [Bacteroides sp.]|nr:single-stranded DNA-binding protein [Prevotella sp.]MCM1407050.1 single-stranded DNA-binding protein [Treponema brennaborense]MCM1470202.1 single-stranded DNA-binding protein [Bacteroides sp.]